MNILVVLAVVAVFGLLRFRRANLLVWAVAWWVGIYVLLRFGFTAPIPASVVSLYMGIVSIAILAYVSSSQERRDEVSGPLVRFMTEKRYTAAPRRDGRRDPGARGRERLRPDERAARSRRSSRGRFIPHRRPRSRFTTRRSTSTLATTPSGSSRNRIRKSSANMSRTGARSTIGTASSATATTWLATACSCTGWIRSRPTSPTGPIAQLRETFLFWRIAKGGPGLPEEGGPWDTAMPAWEKILKEEEMWEAILFLYDFTGQKPRAREEVGTNDLLACWCARASRCPGRVVCCRDGRIGARWRLRTSGPRRSASRARSSTSSTARSATATRVTAKATPRRICTPGRATSRPASSRFGRLPTERSRPIRTSSTSSGAACPTRRCPPGPTSPTRKCRISPTSSRRSRPTSRTAKTSPSPWSSRARRAPRTSRSSSGRSSTWRPAASSATARSAGATDRRLRR